MNGKPAIKSKTIIANTGITIAGILALFVSVQPFISEAVSGNAFWAGVVAVVAAVANVLFRLTTNEPIKGAIKS